MREGAGVGALEHHRSFREPDYMRTSRFVTLSSRVASFSTLIAAGEAPQGSTALLAERQIPAAPYRDR